MHQFCIQKSAAPTKPLKGLSGSYKVSQSTTNVSFPPSHPSGSSLGPESMLLSVCLKPHPRENQPVMPWFEMPQFLHYSRTPLWEGGTCLTLPLSQGCLIHPCLGLIKHCTRTSWWCCCPGRSPSEEEGAWKYQPGPAAPCKAISNSKDKVNSKGTTKNLPSVGSEHLFPGRGSRGWFLA